MTQTKMRYRRGTFSEVEDGQLFDSGWSMFYKKPPIKQPSYKISRCLMCGLEGESVWNAVHAWSDGNAPAHFCPDTVVGVQVMA